MRVRRWPVLIWAGVLLLLAACAGAEPGDASYLIPTVAQEEPASTSGVSVALGYWYQGYRSTLSRARGSVCAFSPSCSRYSQEAIQRYGLVQGLMMTGDRLERCHCCILPLDYPNGTVAVEGRAVYDDPVDDHDYFHKELP